MKLDKKTLKVFANATQIGFTAITSILLGLLLGIWIDSIFHNKMIIVFCIIFGIYVGFKTVWDLLKDLIK